MVDTSVAVLLAEVRAAGLAVSVEDGRLIVRGPRRAESLARAVLDRKHAVLALLAADDPAVAWRVTAMRVRQPHDGPLPFLTVRDVPRRGVGCLSCGEPLQARTAGEALRCGPCAHAALLVLDEQMLGELAREWASVGPALGMPAQPSGCGQAGQPCGV